MKKTLFITLLLTIFLLTSVSAFVSSSPNNLYIDVNRIYPLVLVPLDNNVWDIDLWVYDGNWSSFNFTWSGSQYELSVLFTQTGDYLYVINSTEVIGDIVGYFYVREPFNVTFRFYKDKSSTIFSSNKYVNNLAYLTAEFTGTKTLFQNNYNANLEPFIARISDDRFLKSVWHSKYNNGEATLKLYETGEYAVRLIDGDITFSGIYSVPNITKNYGVNVYVGKYIFTNTTSYSLLLTEKDLNPFKWLFNWIFVILVGSAFIISIFLFFVIPDKPLLSIIFGVGFISMLTLLRIIVYIWGIG